MIATIRMVVWPLPMLLLVLLLLLGWSAVLLPVTEAFAMSESMSLSQSSQSSDTDDGTAASAAALTLSLADELAAATHKIEQSCLAKCADQVRDDMRNNRIENAHVLGISRMRPACFAILMSWISNYGVAHSRDGLRVRAKICDTIVGCRM